MESTRSKLALLFLSALLTLVSGCVGGALSSIADTSAAESTPSLSGTLALARTRGASQNTVTSWENNGSWMSPNASKGDLLYIDASTVSGGGLFLFSYPKGKLVGQIAVPGPGGLCADAQGNVFVTTASDYVLEFAHGGTAPIAMLSDPGYYAYSCAIDPTSGDLAVANYESKPNGAPGSVAIYRHAHGTPQLYSDPEFYLYEYCSYDNAGNLFVDGRQGSAWFAELPKGSDTFTNITVNPSIDEPSGIQWDGTYVAIGNSHRNSEASVYRVAVSGTVGTIVDSMRLKKPGSRHSHPIGQFSLQGHHLIGPSVDFVGFWRYPKGGKSYKSLDDLHRRGAGVLLGSAISRAN